MVQMVLADYKIFNAEVLFRGDYTIDQFIDIVVGNRIYMPCLYVFNKIDQISLEEVDRIARTPNSGLAFFLKICQSHCHFSLVHIKFFKFSDNLNRK